MKELVFFGSFVVASAIGAHYSTTHGLSLSDGTMYGQIAWCACAALYWVGTRIG